MTTDEPSITTADELQSELGALLRAAHAAGVDVEGGWDCRNRDGHPDWDIVVTEVASETATD